MFKTKFSVQLHLRRRKRSKHIDLRVLTKDKSTTWSWAFPKGKFPEDKQKVLAIRTENHPASYMYFEGRLKNGDKVSLVDRGECKVIIEKENFFVLYFRGKNIKGGYNFIRIQSSKDKNAWIVMKTKRYGKKEDE